MLLSREEVERITARRLAAAQADGCIVHVSGSDKVNLRFARNSATSNGARSGVSVTITSQFGQRSGSVTVNGLDEDALDAAQHRCEEIARQTPPDPEQMPPPGPHSYPANIAYDADTAGLNTAQLASAAQTAIAAAEAVGVDAAGYAEAGGRFRAVANSAGLFAYERDSIADFTVTARRKDGSWSGWAGGSQHRFGALDPAQIASTAVAKAAHDAAPRDLEPGRYTVLLEPSATGEMLRYLMWSLDARSADEGRSWLSGASGQTKLGQQLLNSRVTLTSDPADTLAPSPTFDRESMPHERTVWVEDGVVKTLACSRYWAEKTGRAARPAPAALSMAGGASTLEDMIRATGRGILVTRVWYTNMLDPQSLLLTGLTRDGNFLIEDGEIVGPVRNFRFNESLIAMLSNIEAIGPSERIHGGDLHAAPVAAPPMLVRDFTLSSRSAGI
jgi:predicted Zn-dependent protease